MEWIKVKLFNKITDKCHLWKASRTEGMEGIKI